LHSWHFYVAEFFMKNVYFILLLLAGLPVFSQKNFEGIITYTGKSPSNSSKGIEVTYGKSALRAVLWETKENGEKEYDARYRLYDFEKGLTYLVRTKDSVVQVDSLHIDEEDNIEMIKDTSARKTILQYPCVKLTSEKDTLPGSTFLDMEIWQSNALSYVIPDKYRNKHLLVANESGNILWLGMELKYDFKNLGNPRNGVEIVIIEATDIQPGKIPDSLLSIPASYKMIFGKIVTQEITLESIEVEEDPEPPPRHLQSQNPKPG
jgi:hypothetical protein